LPGTGAASINFRELGVRFDFPLFLTNLLLRRVPDRVTKITKVIRCKSDKILIGKYKISISQLSWKCVKTFFPHADVIFFATQTRANCFVRLVLGDVRDGNVNSL
jgi:hypothetical protein